MKHYKQTTNHGHLNANKLAYNAPVLREFGAVGALTQSGSGQNIESTMGGPIANMMRRP